MKEGRALCISCGQEPKRKEIPKEGALQLTKSTLEKTLDQKIESLSKELEQEKEHEKQQSILKSINSLLETIDKIKNK